MCTYVAIAVAARHQVHIAIVVEVGRKDGASVAGTAGNSQRHKRLPARVAVPHHSATGAMGGHNVHVAVTVEVHGDHGKGDGGVGSDQVWRKRELARVFVPVRCGVRWDPGWRGTR